ncbi:P4c precursor [Hypsugopox virus]|nr:P4c precursor [Hypsugopox virus]
METDLGNLWLHPKKLTNNIIDLWHVDKSLENLELKENNKSSSETNRDENRVIHNFAKLITDTINKKIDVDKNGNKDTSTICINRRQRNIIKDVFRYYMMSKPSLTQKEKDELLKKNNNVSYYGTHINDAPLQWVLESFINNNEFYKKLKKEKYKKSKNGNGKMEEEMLETRFKQIKKDNNINNANVWPKPSSYSDTFNKMETLGEFILFFVFDIIEARKFNEGISTKYNNGKPLDLPIRFKYACEQYLYNQIRACNKLKAKNLFIGLPMYYWYQVNPAEVQVILSTLSHYKYAKQIDMFLRYLSSNGRHFISTTVGKVSLTFLDEEWDFHHSVPEMVLFGLSYSVYDHLVKYGKDKLEVFIMEKNKNSKHKDGYKYITVSNIYEGYVEMPYKKAVEHEVINEDVDEHSLRNNELILKVAEDVLEKAEMSEAIRIIKSSDTPDHHHSYYAKRGILLAANECKNLEDSAVDANDDGNEKDTSLLIVDPFIYMPMFYPHKDKPTNIRIHLDREIVRRLEDRYNKLNKYCCNDEKVKALEHNFETMRQYAIVLSKKVDYQTFTHNNVTIPIHSIDHTYPPQKEHYKNIYKRPNKYNKYGYNYGPYIGIPIFNYRYPFIFNRFRHKYIF